MVLDLKGLGTTRQIDPATWGSDLNTRVSEDDYSMLSDYISGISDPQKTKDVLSKLFPNLNFMNAPAAGSSGMYTPEFFKSNMNAPALIEGNKLSSTAWQADPKFRTYIYDEMMKDNLDKNSGGNYDFLLEEPGFNPGAPSPVIPDGEVSGEGGVTKYFDQYLKAINAPSSVEEVQKRLETDALTQTLAQIDKDIAKSIADVQMTGEEYGIGGPGQLSEPIMSGVAQAAAQGATAKAGARTQLMQAQLAREGEKEKMRTQAYGEMFKMYPQLAQLSQGELKIYADLYDAAENRKTQKGITYAELTSADARNRLDNVYKALISGKELDSKERMFYDELDYNIQRDLLDRASKERIAKMGQGEEDDFWGGLSKTLITGFTSGVAGGAGEKFSDWAMRKGAESNKIKPTETAGVGGKYIR